MSTWSQWIPTNEISEKFIRAEFYAPEFLGVDGMIKALPNKRLNKISKSLFQGWSPKGGVKNKKGIPAIKVQDLSGHGVSFDFKCAEVETNAVPERAWAKQDDIFVIRCAHHPRYIGLNIDNYYERNNQSCPFITEKIIVARGVTKSANAGYVTSFLRTNYGYLQVQRRLGGLSANYTPADFGEIRIPLPDSSVQEHIGRKVYLAERCREVSKELWIKALDVLSSFIGFKITEDAFVPKSTEELSSHNYKSLSINPAVSSINYSRIEDYIGAQFFHPQRSKALLVLENSGVKLKKLADIAHRKNNRISANELAANNYRYIGLSCIDSNSGHVSFDDFEDITGTCALFEGEDIVFSKLRPYLNKVAICPPGLKRCAGSTELVVYRAKKNGKSLLPVLCFEISINSQSSHQNHVWINTPKGRP